MQDIYAIMSDLEAQSARPMENTEQIKNYIKQSLDGEQTLTVYNWECPPRTLKVGKNGPYLNYDLDLEKIFKGELLDAYTELPRVVEQKDREIRILNFLSSLGMRYRFVKVIADTNAYYLSPQSIAGQGEGLIRGKFNDFQTRIREIVSTYPVPVDVVQYTQLIRPFKDLYSQVFQDAYSGLQKGGTLLSEEIVAQQCSRTERHIGAVNQKFIQDFSLRTIASYGAEGVVFDSLANTKDFSNCVWLNIEEVDDRTIAITNFMRRSRNIDSLPMLFIK